MQMSGSSRGDDNVVRAVRSRPQARRWTAAVAVLGMAAAMVATVPVRATALAAGGVAGGIEQWGWNGVNTPFRASYPAAEGPWVGTATGSNALVGIKADGTFALLRSSGSVVSEIGDVAGQPIRAIDVYGGDSAVAVLTDGSVRVWGSTRGLVKTLGDGATSATVSLDALDGEEGDGRSVEADQVAIGSTVGLIRLVDGRVGMVSANFGYEIVADLDTGEVLTDAVELASQASTGFVLRGDGSVVAVDTSNGPVVVAPADATDPIVAIDAGVGLRRSGEIVKFGIAANSVAVDPHAPTEMEGAVQVAKVGGNCTVRTEHGRVAVWDCSNGLDIHEDYQPPTEIQGWVLDVTGDPSGYSSFQAIVAEPVTVATDSSVSAAPRVGVSLTGTPATFAGSVVSTEVAWHYTGYDEDDAPLSTEVTYTPSSADEGKQLVFVTVAHQPLGADDVASVSEPTDEVEAAPVDPVAVTTPASISSTPAPLVGNTLTGNPAVFSATEGVSVTNEWVRAPGGPGDAVVGTEATLALTTAYAGQQIVYRSTATRGSEAPVVSISIPVTVTAPVVKPPTPAKVTPAVVVKVVKKPTVRKAGKAKVTVTGGTVATGKVTVTVTKGKKAKKATGTLKKNGVAKVKLKKLPKKGKWTLSASYAGDATHNAAVSKAVKVKVKRK